MANHPGNADLGRRTVNFGRELYIERSDFEEVPPPKFKRLISGGEVRLRSAYVIRCDEVIKDSNGNITELRCSHDPDTLGKKPEGRKVKGVIHWVNASEAVATEVRLYDRLFSRPDPLSEEDFTDAINPESLHVHASAFVEPSVADAHKGTRFQFERQGYFVVDDDATTARPVMNRIVSLKDNWTS
jgi:glutaminyl-tRNA synthetase